MVTDWRKHAAALMLLCLSCAASAEDGVTETSILIGQTIGLTGTVADAVKEMTEGANAYFTSVNGSGGVHGRKIELRMLDDKFLPELAGKNAETLLKKDKVFALFQSRGTPQTQAILPHLLAQRAPLVAPSTGGESFHAPVHPFVFNVRAKYQDEVIKAIEHFNTIGMKKIGLLTYEKEDPLGLDGVNGFEKGMAQHKLTPAFITIFPRLNPDFEATAAKVVAANPQALIIVSSGRNTTEIIKAIRAQGGLMQIMVMSNNSSLGFIKDVGPAGAGVIVAQITPPPHLISSRLGKEFQAAAKATGATTSYAAMEGFVSAKVLVEGLRKAGRNLTREGFVRALESMQRVDMGGVLITYSPSDHSGSAFVELTLLGRDGKFLR
jgi:branched-chain amino acid transport system substrate-binding protein